MHIDLTSLGVMLLERDPTLGPFVRRRDGDQAGGFFRERCRPSDFSWLARVLLNLGTEAQVLGPAELQDLVRQEAEAIARFYSRSTT